jgi:hypothetical protein
VVAYLALHGDDFVKAGMRAGEYLGVHIQVTNARSQTLDLVGERKLIQKRLGDWALGSIRK